MSWILLGVVVLTFVVLVLTMTLPVSDAERPDQPGPDPSRQWTIDTTRSSGFSSTLGSEPLEDHEDE